jgi:hypothetical protein
VCMEISGMSVGRFDLVFNYIILIRWMCLPFYKYLLSKLRHSFSDVQYCRDTITCCLSCLTLYILLRDAPSHC